MHLARKEHRLIICNDRPIILQLAKNPIVSKYDLSSLKMMNSGAAPLTKDLVESCYERLKVPIKQGYGLSETSPTTHSQVWDSSSVSWLRKQNG